MSGRRPKPMRLHNHPAMERKLSVPDGHVVIDSDVFLALVNIHGDYVRKPCPSCGGMRAHHSDHAIGGFERCSACGGTGLE